MTNELHNCVSHRPTATTYDKLNAALERFSKSLDQQERIFSLFETLVAALYELTEATKNDFAKTPKKQAALAKAQAVLNEVKKLPGVTP